jgi:hypothetical protein
MLTKFEIKDGTVWYDKLARTWPLAMDVNDQLIRYVFQTEAASRTPFGALNKFLEEGRLDAVVAYAAMYCEKQHNENMKASTDDEEVAPVEARKPKPVKD